MTDRRVLRSNGRVAHSSLAGQIAAQDFVLGETAIVSVPVADLRDAPGGAREKQLLAGQEFTVLERIGEDVFGFDPVDGYVGYLFRTDLGERGDEATHVVAVRSSHTYVAAEMKSRDVHGLSYGTRLAVTSQEGGFCKAMPWGWVPVQHLRPLDKKASEPAREAETFIGTPYLWGGNSGFGLDCSGLVQLACHACGVSCPRDADQQEAAFARIAPGERRRGDLVFWKGHVGMLLDKGTLIHANAHHMAVAVEPLAEAIRRIGQKEFGAVTGYGRVDPPL